VGPGGLKPQARNVVTTSAKRQNGVFIDTAYKTEGARRSVLGHKPPAEFEAEFKAGCANAIPGRSTHSIGVSH